jgi:hypothetical protein
LALLLLIFFEPNIRLSRHDRQEPVIAVLIDDSQSMTIKDASGDRAEQLRSLLSTNIIRGLPGGTVVKYYPFSSRLRTAGPFAPESLRFEGEVTNLSEAFSGLKSLLPKENIQEAVLISDGNYTAGKNPLYDAEALGIPVSTIGIGDTTEQKDVLIEKLGTNNLAYTETRVPVDVTVRSSGYDGDRVEVILSDGAEVLDRATITLRQNVRRYTANMHVVLKEEGTKKLTVGVSKLPGELTERNNIRSFFITVLKSKLNVLLLAGSPNPDVAAVRQALLEDKHINVQSLVQKSVNQFYEGAFSKTAVDSADCLVLIGFPSAASTKETIQQLANSIAQGKKPFLFINSKSIDYNKLQLLESLLPFSWSGAGPSEGLVGLAVTDRYKYHSLIEFEGRISATNWQQLPPIYKSQTTFRSKPESEVLASVVIQSIGTGEPLLLLRNINRQKSCGITGHGIWRWRLLAQGTTETEAFLPLFITNTIRWLTTKEDNKRVRIVPVKETFTTTEGVEFSGQVYDDLLRPVDDAEVIVRLEHGNEKYQLAMNALGNGMYEGAIDGVPEADYTYTAVATSKGNLIGEDRGKLSVGQVNVEFLETRMNKALLEQIAFRTSGTYRDAADANAISGDLSSRKQFESRDVTTASEIELWNWKYLAAAVVLLFSVEWFLRKRSGML